MDVAIVTGAATGIGLAISRKLVDIGCRVYGLGGNYSNTSYSHDYFVPTPCDLSKISEIENKVRNILEKEGNIFILINNAKIYPTQPLEKIDPDELETILNINLLCPLVITRLALPSLKRLQGFIINVTSTSSETARGGVLGAATDGGLQRMSESLFENYRAHGVKVTTLFPRANRALTAEAIKRQSRIDPEVVADAVGNILSHREGTLFTEIVIRPQREQEEPELPPLEIPYPPAPTTVMPRRNATAKDLARTEKSIKKAAAKAKENSEERERSAPVKPRQAKRPSRRKKSTPPQIGKDPRDSKPPALKTKSESASRGRKQKSRSWKKSNTPESENKASSPSAEIKRHSRRKTKTSSRRTRGDSTIR